MVILNGNNFHKSVHSISFSNQSYNDMRVSMIH